MTCHYKLLVNKKYALYIKGLYIKNNFYSSPVILINYKNLLLYYICLLLYKRGMPTIAHKPIINTVPSKSW